MKQDAPPILVIGKRPSIRVTPTLLVIALFAALVIGLVLFTPMLGNPQYLGFRRKSPTYYADFTKACDSILTQHPLGTNKFIELSVTDPSLPKIIRDLPPFKIQVWPKRVWILAGGTSHFYGFGITREQQDGPPTNLWALATTAESHETVVYVAKR